MQKFAVPRRAVADLSAYLADLDPALITTAQAAELYAVFAEVRRLGSAGELLLAPRAAQSEGWKDDGHRSAAAWMAATSGTGLGEAIATLETGTRLEALPATAEAVRRGTLSAPQAKEIAAAAAARPSAEAELLEAAGACTVKGLKDRCRAVRARAGSAAAENERYEAIRRTRFLRHWSDPDGAFRAEMRLTPDDGASLLASLERRTNERFDEGRTAGRHEPTAAYAADALVDLVTGRVRCTGTGPADAAPASPGSPTTSAPRAVVHVRIDAGALRRGHADDGETCEIPGVGPVPVASVRALLPEAFVKLLVHDGVDVTTVCHVGRTVPAHVRSALEERDPQCVVPGCDVALGLEIDHYRTAFAEGGPTALENLARLCHFHHAMKTYRGFELRGGPGKWEWEPPPEFASG